MAYKVSILLDNDLSERSDPFVIALLPLKDWLFNDNGTIIPFKASYLAKIIHNIAKSNAEDILNLSLSGNVLADLFTKVRPTGYIVKTVDIQSYPVINGLLQNINEKILFVPRHKGIPQISLLDNGNDLSTDYNNSKRELFCKLIRWDEGAIPIGRLLDSCPINYNQLSILSPQILLKNSNLSLNEAVPALLRFSHLKDEPFPKLVLEFLQKYDNYFTMDQKQIGKRENFSEQCVLSIDPEDARDLDDALHIEEMANGNYQVGVHIADVSFYVWPDTPVDSEAALRTTSIYLVHKVIPMLPEILSEKLCSLNPNEQKLTFSVIFVVSPGGDVISERFVKSVVQTKMRLSYDDADKMIDDDTESLKVRDHPHFDVAQKSVKMLNKLAKVIRAKRIEKGAFVFDDVKVKFNFDNNVETSDSLKQSIPMPMSFSTKVRGQSSFLIEEWMLLANQAAARLLHNHITTEPKSRFNIGALLRQHQVPDKKQSYSLMQCLKAAGFKLQPENLQQQIMQLKSTSPSKSLFMSYLCYFNMQLAKYCCAERIIDEKALVTEDGKSPFHHYGLNVPLYTHFTSPIRRYADIIVHRQISAIIREKYSCGTSADDRLKLCISSNEIRLSSRRMYEELQSLYMAAYLSQQGWRVTKAVILTEYNNSVKIMLPFAGIILFTDFASLTPWAYKVKKTQRDKNSPMMYQLTYCRDRDKYKVETSNGFTQYAYVWPRKELNEDLDEIDEEEDYEENQERAVVEKLEENIGDIMTGNSSFDDKSQDNDTWMGENEEEQQQSLTGTMVNNDNSKEDSYGTFELQLSEPFDCLIFCSNNMLKLSVEIPYPELLSEFKDDTTRYIETFNK